jgi:hypothetical protein
MPKDRKALQEEANRGKIRVDEDCQTEYKWSIEIRA